MVLGIENTRGLEGAAAMLGTSEELNELAELEAEMNVVSDDFIDSALAAVHFIVKRNVASLNLFNLYGDGGDKFMVGGLFVRRAKNWRVCGKLLSEDQPQVVKGAAGTNIDVNHIVSKIAGLDVRALALLRHRFPKLIIPLACVVDYYGIAFEIQTPSPLTLNSLVYGSDTEGLLFKNDDS